MATLDTILADWTNPPECRLFMTANTQQIPHNLVVPVSWDAVDKDTLSAFTSPYYVTIPEGVVLFRATACAQWAWRSDYGRTVMMIAKNYTGDGTGAEIGMPHDTRGSTVPYGADPQHNLSTPWIPCVQGDTVSLLALHNNGAQAPSYIVGGSKQTWFCVEFRR